MGRNRSNRKTHHFVSKKKQTKRNTMKNKQLLLFNVLPIPKEGYKIKKSKKISPVQRKIYNNTYRSRLKGVKVDTHKKTIYTDCEKAEKILLICQVKNLIKLGFVVQIEIT